MTIDKEFEDSAATETAETARRVLVLMAGSIFLCVVCVGIATMILPNNCDLFSSNIPGGLECDGFDFRNPQPCRFCEDRGTAMAAQVFAGLGIAFLAVPGLVFFLNQRRKGVNEPTTLLD
jgi:hypothetical protein